MKKKTMEVEVKPADEIISRSGNVNVLKGSHLTVNTFGTKRYKSHKKG